MKAFKPFRTKPLGLQKSHKPYEPNPSYNGQFKSMHMKEFDSKKDIICPSRKELHDLYTRTLALAQ